MTPACRSDTGGAAGSLCARLPASFFASNERLSSTMDGAAAAAAASIANGDHPTVVCAACSQSSGPFSKRQLKKAQAGEPARK